MQRQSKYGAKKVWIDGFRFDSKMEGERYSQLRMLERAKKIFNLSLHPKFRIAIAGEKICDYFADFAYQTSKSGRVVVEDVKGFPTQTFKLKWKLVIAIYGDRYDFKLWPDSAQAMITGKRGFLKKYADKMKRGVGKAEGVYTIP